MVSSPVLRIVKENKGDLKIRFLSWGNSYILKNCVFISHKMGKTRPVFPPIFGGAGLAFFFFLLHKRLAHNGWWIGPSFFFSQWNAVFMRNRLLGEAKRACYPNDKVKRGKNQIKNDFLRFLLMSVRGVRQGSIMFSGFGIVIPPYELWIFWACAIW